MSPAHTHDVHRGALPFPRSLPEFQKLFLDTLDDLGDDMTDAERIEWHEYLDEAHRARVDDEDERFPGWRR